MAVVVVRFRVYLAITILLLYTARRRVVESTREIPLGLRDTTARFTLSRYNITLYTYLISYVLLLFCISLYKRIR